MEEYEGINASEEISITGIGDAYISFETGYIPPGDLLKILGLNASNNYRKMHGGVMDRRRPIKKRRLIKL